MRTLLALLLASLLLSGCSSGAPDDAPVTAADDANQEPQPALEADQAPAPPALGHCLVTRTAANTPLGAGLNLDTMLFDEGQTCPFAEASARPDDYDVALVEVAWDALGASETEVHLRIDTTRCGGSVPILDGCDEGTAVSTTSPLVLELDSDALQRNAGEALHAYVYATGFSLMSDFHVYISLHNGTVPDGYTAIPA